MLPPSPPLPRLEAINWLIQASTHFAFSPQTTLLSVSYFDRFASSRTADPSHPWLSHLLAVACLSLAAKLEETHVPLLLHLQVESPRFLFEARTVMRMELLVLETLGWRMKAVTPMDVVDRVVEGMGTTDKVEVVEFRRRCSDLLLSVVSDPRWLEFLPSVLASAAMFFVLSEYDEISIPKNQISTILNMTEEEVNSCYDFIMQAYQTCTGGVESLNRKRKHPCYYCAPPSPDGVLGSILSSDNSNDSWKSVSSEDEHHPSLKKPSLMATD